MTPAGQALQVVVPAGIGPGMPFMIEMPSMPVVQATAMPV